MKYWFGYLTAAIFGAITWVLMRFGERFKTLVDMVYPYVIRTAQPDAKIILQGIIMVSKIKSTENACFDPGNLRSMNERIAALADGETVFYIDANVVFVGEDGYLYPHLSGDGCHFYPEYAVDWAEWISLEAAKLGI